MKGDEGVELLEEGADLPLLLLAHRDWGAHGCQIFSADSGITGASAVI